MASLNAKKCNSLTRTFLGYIKSTMCVIFSFSRMALQPKQVIMFLPSIPRSCVTGAAAREHVSGKLLSSRGLCGNEFPSELR
jgi:hypothetical protein